MNLKYGYLKMNEQELDQLCPNSFNLKSSEHRGDGGEEVTLRCACSCLKNQAAWQVWNLSEASGVERKGLSTSSDSESGGSPDETLPL